jgi:O-antigen biosynthesis protein
MVSIIILVRDDIGFITRCVESILKHTTSEYEFVFVAQAVSDPVKEYLESIEHKKVILYNDANTGVTPGRNLGINFSVGSYLLFFDDDAFVSEELDNIPEELREMDWLERILLEFSDEDVGVAGQSGSYVRPETPGMFWECTQRHCRCDVVQGYCFMFSRDVVDKCGILDEAFGKFWHEESEYALRAKYNGFKVISTKYIGVSHAGSGSGDDGTYGEKIAYMFKKWGPHFGEVLCPVDEWNK